ncbi:MAG: 30S ribosomal protein S6 [Deltaproteobacteria bacterium]|nr:30S ribosomal protein S6 [Deltaproteobacteria bacterium]
MRHYETIFIVHPELSEEDTAACVEKFRGLLEKDGAFIVKEDHWGRRRLAYTVKKQNKGYFVLMEYGASGDAVDELERNFKIDEQVIRYLTVKIADSFDEEAMAKLKAEAEAAKAADAPAPKPEEDEDEEAESTEQDDDGDDADDKKDDGDKD